MKIAVEGCCHGELDAIYSHIASLERKEGYTVDLLLIGGDFQAIRNHGDLSCMAVPPKFLKLGEFHQYYTGKKVAPILTIIIGGNHEASNYLWELYHGGWLAKNIYYLGAAGCVNVNGIRIAGASGIFKSHDYNLGHYETMPYDRSSMRSIYHIRKYDVAKLLQLSSSDVFLSHDWPQGIEQWGDLDALLQRKPFFRTDIERGDLGSPPLLELLKALKPTYWFSAHLHTKFKALFEHGAKAETGNLDQEVVGAVIGNPEEIVIEDDEFDAPTIAPLQNNPDEIVIDEDEDVIAVAPPVLIPSPLTPKKANPDEIIIDDDEDFDVEVAPTQQIPSPDSNTPGSKHPTAQDVPGNATTKFLALDKCLPRRDFLEVIDIPTATPIIPPPSTSPSNPPKEPEPEPKPEPAPTPAPTIPPPSTEESEPFPFDLPTSFGSTSKSLPNPKSHKPKPIKSTHAPKVKSNLNSNPGPSSPRSIPRMTFDPEWLAITRALHPYLSTSRSQRPLPSAETVRDAVKRELVWVRDNLGEGGVVEVESVQSFVKTADGPKNGEKIHMPMWYTNPQTVAYCDMLQIENKINPAPPGHTPTTSARGPQNAPVAPVASGATLNTPSGADKDGGTVEGGNLPEREDIVSVHPLEIR